MVEVLSYSVLGFYTIALVIITIYCLMQFHLLLYYKKFHRREPITPKPTKILDQEENWPFVTIQLPLYNEKYVVDRLIDNIMQMDYPKDRFEVHILDDSTDECLALSKAKEKAYREQGYNIQLITRPDRVGYKAGALKYGMPFAQGEFIAIFDADFLPNHDFLKNTIPHFQNNKVGVVQTRWEHINQDYSLITELQAFQLNVHFTVEQLGRQAGSLMLQFNGTAGVWRKDCIDGAGGWEADTLTEDLDLSYRAQLKGWEIVYLEDIVSPAELPAEMNSLKSQQYRWMKGGAETAKKMLPTVWKSDLGLQQKLYASGHLLGSSIFLSVFLVGVFSVPLIFIIKPFNIDASILGIFALSTLSILAVYYVANVQTAWKEESWMKKIMKFILIFPVFLALSMGLSLHNSIAVLQGFFGKQSAFVRTPKFDIKTISDKIQNNKYVNSKLTLTTIFEGVLTLYFIGGIISGVMFDDLSFIIFHILLALGYGTIFYLSVKHLKYG